jgi:hypothetical protein
MSTEALVEKLEYPSVEAMEHAAFRAEVREYRRKSKKAEKGVGRMPNKPVRAFVHPGPCEFSDASDSSSGEETDEEIDATGNVPIRAKLFDALSPEPLVESQQIDFFADFERNSQPSEFIDDSVEMEAAIVDNLPMIEQFDDAAVDGMDAPDGADDGPAEMVGLADTSEFLTIDQGMVKLRSIGAQFFKSPGIFPTFSIASGKFISCSFSPAASNDAFDPYGLKVFFLHCCKVTSFSDPKSGVIPLSTTALRDLVGAFGTFVAHARSKLTVVSTFDERTKQTRMIAPNPIRDLKIGNRMKCPCSGNYGQVWVKFIHAQNGDPLCVVDFTHHRIACEPDGRRPVHHTNFVVQVQTIFHLVKNVFPLMAEFQKFVCEKADALVQRWKVSIPPVSEGQVVVNDIAHNPNATWERGLVERADV